jgi:HD-GYP domain-containing protein (c-di-GMP phosphodiesterase class II)/DNA-binding response OmpR family regulator
MSKKSTQRRALDAADSVAVRDAVRVLEQARLYQESGEGRRAVRLLQDLLEKAPSYVAGYEALADVLMAEGRYAETLAVWERLLEIEPGHERALAGVDHALDARARRYTTRPPWHATPRPDPGWPGTVAGSRRVDAPPPQADSAVSGPGDSVVEPAAAIDLTTTVALADLLMGLLEYADPFFRGNASQTRLVAGALARRLGLDASTTAEIELAALLRDIGKLPLKGMISPIGSQLPADGRRYVERHVITAIDMLDGISLPENVRLAVRHHHERWDGSGYPDGLRGKAIPLVARVLAVADTFAAMIAARPHRLPHGVESTLTDLRESAGSQYDPQIIDALLSVVANTSWRGAGFGLRQHIVVVDPDETRAVVEATRLCSRGYLAEAAFSAAGAMTRLNRSRVSAVAALVVSAELPPDDVELLLQHVRQAPATAFTPVVVVHAPTDARLALLEAGADLCLEPDTGTAELAAVLQTLLRRDRVSVVRSRAPTGDSQAGLRGSLEDFPLSWLLQVLHYDGRTVAVFVTAPDNEGTIYLDRGNPRLAQTRELSGEAAFRALLKWRRGTFIVDPTAETDRRTISRPLMNLLIEEAVRDDHSAFATSIESAGPEPS